MAKTNGNDLIRQLQNTISEEIEVDEKHDKVKTKCRFKVESLMNELIKLGQAFEVIPDKTLYKPGITKRRFDIFEDFMFVLRQMELPEDAIKDLSQGAKGEDLVKYLKKNGWQKIPDTNIWVKFEGLGKFNSQDYEDIQPLPAPNRVLATSLIPREDGGKEDRLKIVFLVDTTTGEKLTKGHRQGVMLDNGNIGLYNETDNLEIFTPDGELLYD